MDVGSVRRERVFHRLGTRGFLWRWGMGAASLSALLVGCGADQGDPQASVEAFDDFCASALSAVEAHLGSQLPQAPGPEYGGTAVVGAIGEMVDGMNALVSGEYAANQHQRFVNLMTLVRPDEALEPIPYLAQEWEFSPEGDELTFHLREDVLWHDGTPTTAHDVAFTFVRATDPATGFPNSAYWAHYVPGPEGVEVVDDFTVRFQLTPHAEPLDPWGSMAILPSHLLGDVPPEQLRAHPFGNLCPVGNGPFRFVEHRTNDRWVFQANPDFPEALGGRPRLDRLVFRVIPEMTTLLTELLTGGVDVYVGVGPDQLSTIEGSQDARVLTFPFRTYLFIGWNTRDPRLADARVRRAMTLAADREGMVEALLGGYGQVANAGVPPFHWAYNPAMEDALPHDPVEARRLLDEAGWIDRDGDGIRENADGLKLSFVVEYNQGEQVRESVAGVLQAQLRPVGIELLPRVVEWAALVGRITSPERTGVEGFVLGWVPDLRVDDRDLFHSEREADAFGFAGLQDPRVDQLLDTLQLIPSREEARPLWFQYQELLAELQPFTYLFFRDRLVGLHRRVRDVKMDVRGEWVGVTRWWIPAQERR